MKHYKLIQQMNRVVFSCRNNHLESWKRNVYENLNHIPHIWDPEMKKKRKLINSHFLTQITKGFYDLDI